MANSTADTDGTAEQTDNTPSDPLGRVIEAAETELRSLEDHADGPEAEEAADGLAAAIQAVKNDPTTEMEEQLYDDIDAIAEISEHALAELDTGDLDALEGSIRAINDRAKNWSDPDDIDAEPDAE